MQMENEKDSSRFSIIVIIGILINILFYLCYYSFQTIKYFKQKWLNIFNELILSIIHPTEIISIFKIKYSLYNKKVSKSELNQLAISLNDIDFCYATLNKVSRSFSVVIEQLPECLKDSVCIFYLVLRGLDSIEDDMNYPDEKKIVLLRNFHKKLLINNWSIENIGDTKDYKILLENFFKIIHVFKTLDENYQSVILDITEKMGNGMADFVGKTGSIDTVDNYNIYCHYVAGLVGYGLSSLFTHSQLEDRNLYLNKDLSNSMGLFLQKTNIIRDYLEDLQAGRTWWPKEIWINYASDLSQFHKDPNSQQSLECLNHMVMDSFSHLSDVIQYLRLIKHPKIFEFCAIPQLMAIATLVQLYNNPFVFTSVVKIRKGLACELMLNCSDIKQVEYYFSLFINKIEKKIPKYSNINNKHMQELINESKQLFN
ncbi:unnamed protein product [Adineta steineri]|uniref:Squalene synthase n=3 Tax=Adineta steineri TaxID=433720 RepID=A0A819XST6_9BILA|nr:unnamed protein product [Adineta steineri]